MRFFLTLLGWLLRPALGGQNSQAYTRESVLVVKATTGATHDPHR